MKLKARRFNKMKTKIDVSWLKVRYWGPLNNVIKHLHQGIF